MPHQSPRRCDPISHEDHFLIGLACHITRTTLETPIAALARQGQQKVSLTRKESFLILPHSGLWMLTFTNNALHTCRSTSIANSVQSDRSAVKFCHLFQGGFACQTATPLL